MANYSFTGLIGTANPTFSGNVTDLAVAWINGQARLYSATLPGLGGGLAVFDISQGAGPANLLGVQGYASFVQHVGASQITLVPMLSGTGANLIAAGPRPSGWASYAITGGGGFGASLNSPLAFDPTAVASANIGGQNFVFFAPNGAATPTSFLLQDNGALKQVGTAPVINSATPTTVSGLTVASVGSQHYLLSADPGQNGLKSYAIGGDGSLAYAAAMPAEIGVGMSQPTAMATLDQFGTTYVIAAATQSSSLSVFALGANGAFVPVDHVVDNLTTHFAGASALASLQSGDRGYVFAGGWDDGIEVMTILPDGRLIDLMTIQDNAAMALAHVSSLAVGQIGDQTKLFAASATEVGLTQLTLDLGVQGITINGAGGVQTGTAANDVLIAGASTTAIYGGAGDDILVAGGLGGGAVLYGGSGADIFVLSPSDSTMTIADYQVGVDRLDLTSFPRLRSLGQLVFSPAASGMDISYGTTLIHVLSFDGNPISQTAFAQSQVLGLTRFTPLAITALVNGTAGNDLLNATNVDTILNGIAGSDTLNGGDGNDVLNGGDGDDRLSGGLGLDSLDGGAGADLLFGGAGDDTLYGGLGADRLFGGAGQDYMSGGDGNDLLDGGDDNDRLWGDAGDDTLLGGAGSDTIQGGDGRDQIRGEDGNDTLAGGFGADSMYGGYGDDSADGGDGNDWIWGDAGDDTLSGGNDQDNIFGGTGNDSISGGAGADTLMGDEGNDMIDGGTGNDSLIGYLGNDSIFGGDGADIIWGGYGDDTLDGGYGNDTLQGSFGNDRVSGGDGNDIVNGGPDDDYVFGGNGNDTQHGGDGNDFISGDAGNDQIFGDMGNDTLDGGDGADTLGGGPGNDYLKPGLGQDHMWGGFGTDYFVFTSAAIAGKPGQADVIHDFQRGVDKLVLQMGPNEHFSGAGSVSGLGDIRFNVSGAGGYLTGDVDGDGRADWSIRLENVYALGPGDFIF